MMVITWDQSDAEACRELPVFDERLESRHHGGPTTPVILGTLVESWGATAPPMATP